MFVIKIKKSASLDESGGASPFETRFGLIFGKSSETTERRHRPIGALRLNLEYSSAP